MQSLDQNVSLLMVLTALERLLSIILFITSFVYKASFLEVGFTWIASIMLLDGTTSPKHFGIKVPLTSYSTSNMKSRSAKAIEISKVDVCLMEETPMLPKYGLHNIDQLLRFITNPNLAFGGKIMS